MKKQMLEVSMSRLDNPDKKSLIHKSFDSIDNYFYLSTGEFNSFIMKVIDSEFKINPYLEYEFDSGNTDMSVSTFLHTIH